MFFTSNRLTQHLRKKHGNINSGVQIPRPAAPLFPRNVTPVGSSSATPLLWAPGEVRYPSIWTNGPLRTNEVSAAVETRNLPLGRFYCQEHDCGRGFSSEAHLESHARFFHQKKVGVFFSWQGEAEIPLKARTNDGRGERSRRTLK